MNLLILGGTVFVGRHLVESALARGHIVTLFNRGQHNRHLFPDVEKLRGDRDGDLSALEGRKWDAVIDTCGYVPRIVAASANLLASAVERYIFISTISVYATPYTPQMNEQSPLATLANDTTEEITGQTYGPLKVLCEHAAENALPGRVLTIRPGLIVGPHDHTDRFTYWPRRIAQGGDILAPGDPSQPVQFIDARDLAEWTLKMVEANATGIYNATGPQPAFTLEHVLAECQKVLGSDATFRWASETFLFRNQVAPFTDMPLWVPKEAANMLNMDVNKALAAGLTFRPLADTIRDTLAWHTTRPSSYTMKVGLTAEREEELLTAWRNEPQPTEHESIGQGL